MNHEPLVILDSVTKTFGEVVAVDQVSLNIAPGEFLVLLGPSGSGKTTLLSMLGGFITPTAGKILIRGEDVTHLPPATRPTVTVFQDYALFPHMSVSDNIGFGLVMRKIPKRERLRRIAEALEKVGLTGFGERGIHQLSGGQRQRVALARAIAVEPTVLLLDEPLGALDLKIRQKMQEELVHLQKNLHATFVHVTHDQDEAMSIADNIALVSHGKIEDYGSPERIYLRPATLFTARFMGETNIIEVQPTAASDSEKLIVDSPLGQLELPHADMDSRASHNIALRPEQIKLSAGGLTEDDLALGNAKVIEVVFQGAHRLCRAMGGKAMDTELLIKVAPDYQVAAGDMLALQVRKTDAVLLSK